MKAAWTEMSAEIEKQKKITSSLIIKMTKVNYANKINKILLPELIATAPCFALALYVVFNIQDLDNWYLHGCGIGTVLIMFILPLLSLKTVYGMRSVNIANNTYKQSLLEYSKRKKQFVFVQKLSFYLTALLMLFALPVMGKIMAGKDFFKETNLWLWYAVLFPIFYLFARWVFKSYMKSAADAENILNELKD